MEIVLTKLLIPMTRVRGVKTYFEHYLQLYTSYDSNGVEDGGGLAPSGMMELEPDLRLGYDETNENMPETAPITNPEFVTQYDEISVRVEL